MSQNPDIRDQLEWRVRRWMHRSYLRKRAKEFRIGDIVQGCNYHPIRITELDVMHDDLVGVSILNGSSLGCSIIHCGVYKMSAEEIEAHKQAWARDRHRGLALLNGWSPEDYDKMDAIWGFNQPGSKSDEPES